MVTIVSISQMHLAMKIFHLQTTDP